MKIRYYLSLAFTLTASLVFAKENVGQAGGTMKTDANRALSADCNPSASQIDLAINNVRTTILGGGDMWWDLNNARYEIPKLPEGSTETPKHSLFAGSLWIGGVDVGGQLKVAAMTYRQTGNDFWPGPLNTNNATISSDECTKWDTHFRMNRSDVEEFRAWNEDPSSNPNYTIPTSILDWPAHGSAAEGQADYLAPFFDSDNDGRYDPNAGDYPGFSFDNTDSQCEDILFGDEVIFWIFNDKGNIHTETGAEAIGLEIHAQAFGFSTNDEINNMTFYQYKIYNRSTFTLTNTYFGQWVDPDLGNFNDDYVGCDVARGLGYCYNGDQEDEGAFGYGANPPAIGIDFFQGPIADAGDNIDNDRDGLVDEEGEQIIMSKFVYYNNDFSVIGNPENGTHIYNYLRGIFKDGTEMEYGGNGHSPSGGTTGIPADFMFPGKSDLDNFWGTNGNTVPEWSEATEGNPPADRRFLQSAGAFTLEPGAVNNITTGAVWARASQGGPQASVELMKQADDKAQALFDNCFKVLDGPDAPDLTITEMDKEIIITLTNSPNSNNYLEQYVESDPFINAVEGNNFEDTNYVFQGYQIYQLADATANITDILNPDKARLVAQTDIKDGVANIINYEFDASVGADVPIMRVQGENEGIRNTFRITKDLFASGDDRLVNFKQYYYTAIAYGYNNYKTYNTADPGALDGQKKPYLAGRKNIQVYTVTPHDPRVGNGGTNIQSSYGTRPKLTRVSGWGNGGEVLELTPETEEAILAGESVNPTFTNEAGPLYIQVIDPLAIPEGDFKFEIMDTATTVADSLGDGYWVLINETTGDSVFAQRELNAQNEQIIPEWGFSVKVQQPDEPGKNDETNGFISASITYEDPTKPWLTGVSDVDFPSAANWIRSGTENETDNDALVPYNDFVGVDDEQAYEKILDGQIAPYRLVASNNDLDYTAAIPTVQGLSSLENLNSVKLVITSDKSKWTRSPVVELADEPNLAQGGAEKFGLRAAPSVNKEGEADGTGNGMGWFPGYAIDLETGQRLNILFGENSFFLGDNGRDMLWNPTSRTSTNLGDPRFGGMHSIYITRPVYNADGSVKVPAYDEGATHKTLLETDGLGADIDLFSSITWCYAFPMLDERYEFLESDLEIVLNVNNEFQADNNGNLPAYTFNTDDIMAIANDNATAKDVLERINVVPNPYYAHSEYESDQLDNRVRITHLPNTCEIKIFSVNGTLIRKFDKDDNTPFLDWDLKNQANIPVASGVYIIHVDVEGVGEKVLKWFGVMRPIDLDTF